MVTVLPSARTVSQPRRRPPRLPSRSNTLTSIPRSASAHAAASPAIPPPTTATRGVVLGSGADGDGAGVDSARGSVTSVLNAALQGTTADEGVGDPVPPSRKWRVGHRLQTRRTHPGKERGSAVELQHAAPEVAEQVGPAGQGPPGRNDHTPTHGVPHGPCRERIGDRVLVQGKTSPGTQQRAHGSQEDVRVGKVAYQVGA